MTILVRLKTNTGSKEMKAFEMTYQGNTVYIPVESKDDAMKAGAEFPGNYNFPIDVEWFIDLETNEKTLKPCNWGA
jgi:hypothetical protein